MTLDSAALATQERLTRKHYSGKGDVQLCWIFGMLVILEAKIMNSCYAKRLSQNYPLTKGRSQKICNLHFTNKRTKGLH
ncbi:MAG: hypothetical protein KME55_38525 [Nostoc indistinguendum CM1-VF10]|jgi:hypothetical protein|nr:hypothetical protein [Nostoc indistinguendum CM1-VF10]